MKKTKRLMFLIIGLIFFGFLFTNCDKDDDLLVAADQQLEFRKKKDECVTTKTGTTVKVTLPVPPGQGAPPGPEIHAALVAALQAAAANESDPNVKRALDSALVHIPPQSEGIRGFLSEPDIVGVTFPYIVYQIIDGKLVVVVINVQVLEHPVTDKIKAHEDAHNDIANDIANNDKVAEKAAKDSGKDCKDAGDAVTQTIRGLIDNANAAFDKATDGGRKGDQAKEAKKAVSNAVKKYLHPKKK